MPSEQFNNIAQMLKAQRTDERPELLELRANFENLGQVMPAVPDVLAEAVDAGGVPAEMLTPQGTDDDHVILYLHGGGYCIGSLNSHRHVAASIAKACGARALAVDYRLAPEHPFPAAVDDAKTAYRWLLDRGFAPNKIAVAGDSAGAGLTLALLVALRDEGVPLPAAAAPHSPFADLVTLGEVSEEALELDFFRPATYDVFAETYSNGEDRSHPLISPVNADLTGLPPLLVQAGECEILLDTTRRVAAKAKDCGVDVTLEIEPGLFHAWNMFVGAVPEADESIARTARFFRERWSS